MLTELSTLAETIPVRLPHLGAPQHGDEWITEPRLVLVDMNWGKADDNNAGDRPPLGLHSSGLCDV